MCIIVDINTFASVFSTSSNDHSQFKPILNHINNRGSCLIIGGTTFLCEVNKAKKYTKIIAELTKSRRLVKANDKLVDEFEACLVKKFTDPKFNDKHIVALASVSGARVVCTKDTILQNYLKKSEFYQNGKSAPNIYNERSRPRTLPTGKFKPKCSIC
jgi:predicted nucleic acid-binding protein